MSNINKIVELKAEIDNLEFEDVGVEIMSLVDEPAIGIYWAAFAAQHLFVSKIPGESESDYMGRCMPVVIAEGYEADQAAAICYAGFEKFEPDMAHYTPDGKLWEGPTHKHNDRLMTGATHTEDSEYLYHTPNYLQDKEMVDGIIDLLLKVKDPVNRRQMAQDVLNGFDTDKVIYDLDDFVTRIGFSYEEFLPENPCTPGYVAYGLKPKNGRMVPNCIPLSEQDFESYNDYPDSAKNAAQRALDFRDANPDIDCGTPVGWARANQLAKGENISEETIARMASFARHLQYKDVPYTEGCGGLMVDAWGGQAGIEWASSKLKEIRGEEFDINVDGLPNYIDETDGLKPKELDTYQTAILNKASELGFGEVLDIEMTDYVNLSKDKFETISDFLRANNAIDVLDEIVNSGAEQMVLPSYRYTGPIRANSRAFCISMIALGKIYTKKEIDALSLIAFQPGMGRDKTNTYNIFDYKGGVNCNHYWEQLRVFRSPGGRNIVISEGPAPDNAGQVAMSSNNWWRIDRQNFKWKFAEDDDKMIITGPAMKAFQLIPRRDEDGNLFHVYFSDETIKKLSEKFLKDNNQHTTDINHSMEPDEENTLVESWIVEDPEMDKSRVLGFNPGKGDWYVSYKINNKETWKQIKEGKLNGFSIAGQFIERQTAKLKP